uniref:Uncharacterized protein n=1 Tax=Brassica oleracea var. oleracea TaxID=109376 RepID=A0A0D3APW4_BRAOL
SYRTSPGQTRFKQVGGSEDCSLWRRNADKEAYLNMFSGHNQSFTCGDFTPDTFPLLASCECVEFSPSSATIPTAATDGIVKTLIIGDLQHSTPRFNCCINLL